MVVTVCPRCKKNINISILRELNGCLNIECQHCREKIVLQGGHENIDIVPMNMMCVGG